jgi:hypothetical protein
MNGATFRSISAVCIVSSICLWVCDRSTAAVDSWHANPKLYWGTASSVELGGAAEAFVACLPSQGARGGFLRPPGMLALNSFTDEGDSVSFSTTWRSNGVWNFEFSGKTQGVKLEGMLEQWRREPDPRRYRFSVLATETTLVMDSRSRPHVAFSSSHGPNPDTGDISGIDLEILATRNGDRGFVVFYNAGWGEENFIPYHLNDISRGDGVIRFETQLSTGKVRYHLTLSPSSAVLHRDDRNAPADNEYSYNKLRAVSPIVQCQGPRGLAHDPTANPRGTPRLPSDE